MQNRKRRKGILRLYYEMSSHPQILRADFVFLLNYGFLEGTVSFSSFHGHSLAEFLEWNTYSIHICWVGVDQANQLYLKGNMTHILYSNNILVFHTSLPIQQILVLLHEDGMWWYVFKKKEGFFKTQLEWAFVLGWSPNNLTEATRSHIFMYPVLVISDIDSIDSYLK